MEIFWRLSWLVAVVVCHAGRAFVFASENPFGSLSKRVRRHTSALATVESTFAPLPRRSHGRLIRSASVNDYGAHRGGPPVTEGEAGMTKSASDPNLVTGVPYLCTVFAKLELGALEGEFVTKPHSFMQRILSAQMGFVDLVVLHVTFGEKDVDRPAQQAARALFKAYAELPTTVPLPECDNDPKVKTIQLIADATQEFFSLLEAMWPGVFRRKPSAAPERRTDTPRRGSPGDFLRWVSSLRRRKLTPKRVLKHLVKATVAFSEERWSDQSVYCLATKIGNFVGTYEPPTQSSINTMTFTT